MDLTEDKAYTLSAGTQAILKKLDTPVTIRFYCTQTESATPETVYLKSYARKVEDLLFEYKQVAGSKLKIEKYDPQPDSDAEDSARLDGIEPQAAAGHGRLLSRPGGQVRGPGPVHSVPGARTASACSNTTWTGPFSARRIAGEADRSVS